MDEKQKDEFARKLIDITAWSLQQLNGGASQLPDKWQKYMQKSFYKVGHPETKQQRDKHIAIATEVMDYRISIAQWQGAGRAIEDNEKYSNFLEELAAEHGYSDVRSIKRVVQKYKIEAVNRVIESRKVIAGVLAAISKIQGEEIKRDVLEILDIKLPENPVKEIKKWVEDGEKIKISHTHDTNSV